MLRHVFAKSLAAVSRQACSTSATPLLACQAIPSAEGTLLAALRSDMAGTPGLQIGITNAGLVTRTLATSSSSQLVRPASGDVWPGLGMRAFGTSAVSPTFCGKYVMCVSRHDAGHSKSMIARLCKNNVGIHSKPSEDPRGS
jgi:hypothetical protein